MRLGVIKVDFDVIIGIYFICLEVRGYGEYIKFFVVLREDIFIV